MQCNTKDEAKRMWKRWKRGKRKKKHEKLTTSDKAEVKAADCRNQAGRSATTPLTRF